MLEKSYTPAELSKLWGIAPEKVIGWIQAGELDAFNTAQTCSTRPRYRIQQSAIERFILRRAIKPLSSKTQRKQVPQVEEIV